VAGPLRELKAFAKVHLAPGEVRRLVPGPRPRDFAWSCVERQAWPNLLVAWGEKRRRVRRSIGEQVRIRAPSALW